MMFSSGVYTVQILNGKLYYDYNVHYEYYLPSHILLLLLFVNMQMDIVKCCNEVAR